MRNIPRSTRQQPLASSAARAALLAVLGCLSGAGPASRPAAKGPGDSKDAKPVKDAKEAGDAAGAKQARGVKESLVDGQFQFYPPEGWEEVKKSRNATTAAYVAPGHQGAIAVQVLPPDADMDAATAALIVRRVKADRKKSGTKMVMDIAPEKDERFALRLREKYMEGEKTADVLRLYRKVGPRLVMVTIKSLGKSEEDAKPIHATGEEVTLSVEYVRPAGKAK